MERLRLLSSLTLSKAQLLRLQGMSGLSASPLQAYPEYLITYQIMKPEAPSQTATAAEQKT